MNIIMLGSRCPTEPSAHKESQERLWRCTCSGHTRPGRLSYPQIYADRWICFPFLFFRLKQAFDSGGAKHLKRQLFSCSYHCLLGYSAATSRQASRFTQKSYHTVPHLQCTHKLCSNEPFANGSTLVVFQHHC